MTATARLGAVVKRREPLPAAHERFDLGPGRDAGTAAEPRALEAGRGGRKAQRVRDRTAFDQRQREGAVKYVAGRQRVDSVDLEHRHAEQLAAFAPDQVAGSVGDADKLAGARGDPANRFAKVIA